jgi:hypothetical protein
VVDGQPDRLVFVASPRAVMYLIATDFQMFRDARLDGTGSIAGAPLLVTPQAGNKLVAFDATYVASLDAGLEVESSEHAAIQMDDEPSEGPQSVVSAWATDTAVIRLIRYLTWQKTRDDAAQFLELTDLGGSPS